jgi:hypothetical protein
VFNHLERSLSQSFIYKYDPSSLRRNVGIEKHGGATGHSVMWNTDAGGGKVLVQKPPTAQNYAIGCFETAWYASHHGAITRSASWWLQAHRSQSDWTPPATPAVGQG